MYKKIIQFSLFRVAICSSILMDWMFETKTSKRKRSIDNYADWDAIAKPDTRLDLSISRATPNSNSNNNKNTTNTNTNSAAGNRLTTAPLY